MQVNIDPTVKNQLQVSIVRRLHIFKLKYIEQGKISRPKSEQSDKLRINRRNEMCVSKLECHGHGFKLYTIKL